METREHLILTEQKKKEVKEHIATYTRDENRYFILTLAASIFAWGTMLPPLPFRLFGPGSFFRFSFLFSFLLMCVGALVEVVVFLHEISSP